MSRQKKYFSEKGKERTIAVKNFVQNENRRRGISADSGPLLRNAGLHEVDELPGLPGDEHILTPHHGDVQQQWLPHGQSPGQDLPGKSRRGGRRRFGGKNRPSGQIPVKKGTRDAFASRIPFSKSHSLTEAAKASARASMSARFCRCREEAMVTPSSRIVMFFKSSSALRISAPERGAQEPFSTMAQVRF